MHVNLRPFTVTLSSAKRISYGGGRYSPSINRKPVLLVASIGPSKDRGGSPPRGGGSKPRGGRSGAERKSGRGRPSSRSRRPCAFAGAAIARAKAVASASTVTRRPQPRFADILLASPG